MTRAQYEEIYGAKPVFSATSTLDDEKPAPVRMTRAEYEATYYPKAQKEAPLQERLADIGLGSVEKAKQNIEGSGEFAGQTAGRRGAQAFASLASVAPRAGYEMLPEFARKSIEKVFGFIPENIAKAIDTLSETELIKGAAGQQVTDAGGATTYQKNDLGPIEEPLGTMSAIGETAGSILAAEGLRYAGEVTPKVISKAKEVMPKLPQNNGVNNVVKELAKIEDKYVKTRNANLYSKDVDASRTRIAESNVLDGAVDTDGVIRTKGVGGAIDQYKAQTIDGLEDIVRKALIESKETIPVSEVRRVLVREVGNSGLEGADLVSALKKIDKEIEGLNTRIKGSSIVDLRYLHDNKIATTKNINYMTPPEKATYRKAVARAYKMLVEENSKKVEVKKINNELSTYYKDIERLELLDGARAEGGRLGKYTASMAGTLIGGAAGSVGGGVGAAVGGIIGGEAAQVLKGIGMSRTFKGGGKGLPKSAVLEKARLSIPDKAVKAKTGLPKTKEITELEGKIAKNVADQKKAIAKGDFALVQALKEVYTVLVEELKKAIKYLNDNGSVGLSIKKSVTPESVAKKADKADMKVLAKVIDDYDNAILDPNVNRTLNGMGLGRATREERIRFAKDVFDEKDGVASRSVVEPNPLYTEARGKSLEEFMKAQGTPVYHGTHNNFEVFDNAKLGSFTGSPSAKEGHFFASEKQNSKYYAGEGADGVTFVPEVLGRESLTKIRNKIANKPGVKMVIVRTNGARAVSPVWPRLPEGASSKEIADALIARMYKDLETDIPFIKNKDDVPKIKATIKLFEDEIRKISKLTNKETIGDVKEVYLRYTNPKVYDDGGVKKSFTERIKKAKEDGHDAVIFRNTLDPRRTDVFVVFDTSKIKTRSQLTDIWKEANRKASGDGK